MINRLIVPALVLSVFLAAVACAGPKSMSQLRIGVWAAEHELWEEAVFRWSRVLEAEPKSAVARNNLAVAFEKLGRFDDALREYEEAQKLAPNHAQIKANLQRFKLAIKTSDEAPAKKGKTGDEKNEIR